MKTLYVALVLAVASLVAATANSTKPANVIGLTDGPPPDCPNFPDCDGK